MSAAAHGAPRERLSIRPAEPADLARLHAIYAGHVLTGAASFDTRTAMTCTPGRFL